MSGRKTGARMGAAGVVALLALTGCNNQNYGYNYTGTGPSASDSQGLFRNGSLREMTPAELNAQRVTPEQATAQVKNIGNQVGGSGIPHGNGTATTGQVAVSEGSHGDSGSAMPSGWVGMYPTVSPTEGSTVSK